MEKTRVRFFSLWLPVIFWAGLIFFGSSRQAVAASESYWIDFVIKKMAHVFEYAVFYFLLWRALGGYSKKTFTLAFIFLLLYAISDEFHQSLVPGREPRVRDVIIDATGGLLSLWMIKNLLPKVPFKLSNWLSGSQEN